MSTTVIKQGDTLQPIVRPITLFNAPFDFSDPKYKVFTSGFDPGSPLTPLYHRRDVTEAAKAGTVQFPADPETGVAALPIFDGATVVGVGSTPLEIEAPSASITVVKAAGAAGVERQRLYMSLSTGVGAYLVAEGANGFMASPGINIGVAPYAAVSDAELIEYGIPATEDQSDTHSEGSYGVPAAPTVTDGVPAGTVGLGTFLFYVVDVSRPDSSEVGSINFEVIIQDSLTLKEFTFPETGFETINIVVDIEPVA